MANNEALKLVGTTVVNGRSVPFAIYRVAKGDTVYSLWLKFRDKTTVGAIKAANGFETNVLSAGKQIKIPLVL
ncbi:LysM peptidoglycan-binding domain-containing protein [Levilactobacillus lanxiensis]|uniref:LysM peptidoglycan-binding domain-containing protein n=1 Tax=Levilactobacillus lanxiensis TaxID=2799568 RepID=A0ABW4D5A2_9LACO|nr:LysM peptidoglycan-binding domain-containing protein [Levilactobacillus lanxiensis]